MLMAANILSENPGKDAERVDSKRPQKLSLPEQHDPPLFFPLCGGVTLSVSSLHI
jgi:hypothetical protein